MRRQGLTADVGQTAHLALGEVDQLGGIVIERRTLLQQVHHVGERVERIVDLMRDGRDQASGGRQAFGAAQRFFQLIIQLANLLFGQLALGDVANGAGGEGAVLGCPAGSS